MILIVTHRRGFEADRIIDKLRGLGESYFRFNSDILETEPSYSVSVSNDDKSIQLCCDNRKVDIRTVEAAWFQQPRSWSLPKSEMELARQRSHSTLAEAIYSQTNCRWLNRPATVGRASNKILQLLAAHELGVSVPKTFISNNPSDVRSFVAETEELVAKSIGPQWMTYDRADHAAYTQKLQKEWMNADDTAISYAPVAYQEFHDRRRDIRVVAVNRRFFAVECSNQSHLQRYDVRKGDSHYRSLPLPINIKESLTRLMDYFALDFCSADFIETQCGTLLFVDLNVTGSWWWVDDIYNGEISEALTSFLVGAKTSR